MSPERREGKDNYLKRQVHEERIVGTLFVVCLYVLLRDGDGSVAGQSGAVNPLKPRTLPRK